MQNVNSSATEGLQNDINEFISTFESWEKFADFHKKEVSNGEADELNKFERWKAERKRVIRDLADFLHALFGGVHDTVLDKISLEDHKDPFSVEWGCVIKVCENIARDLRKGAATISSTDAESAPPPMAARALTRLKSDPVYEDSRNQDIEKERNDAWQRAIVERKRYVTFATCTKDCN